MAARQKLGARMRIELFLEYCESLVNHPFFEWGQTADKVTHVLRYNGERWESTLSFDAHHLETFLGRMRQLVSPREIFHVDVLETAVSEYIGTSEYLNDTCAMVRAALARRHEEKPLTIAKADGVPTVQGRTYLELLESALYTGQLHSERLATSGPDEATAGWRGAKDHARGDLNFALARWSREFVQYAMNLRRQIYELWDETGRVVELPQLAKFGERVKAAGA